MNIFVSYMHFLSIMTLTGALFAEYILLRSTLNAKRISLLTKVDVIYGLSAVVVLATGLLRWLVYDPKGAAFFTKQHLFHIKMTLFLVVALLSVVPTLRYIKWKKLSRTDADFRLTDAQIKQPLLFIRIEMLIIALIPLLAVLVANHILVF